MAHSGPPIFTCSWVTWGERDTGRRNLATLSYQREVLLLTALFPPSLLSLGYVYLMLVYLVPWVLSSCLCDLLIQYSIPPASPAHNQPVSFPWPHPVLGLFPGFFIHPGNPSEAGDEGILDGSE